MIFTWRGDSVLVGRFVVAQCEQQHLDGPGKDSSQAQVEYHIEQEDLDCGRKGQTFRKMGLIKVKRFGWTYRRSLKMYSNSQAEQLKAWWWWWVGVGVLKTRQLITHYTVTHREYSIYR